MKAKQLLTCFLFFISTDYVRAETSRKVPATPRGFFDFARVNKCIMGVYGIKYNGYGCFCGLRGGGTPIDGIDECCKIHDECYEKANEKVCFKFQVYFDPYNFACKNKGASCSLSNSACETAICECDVAVAECWKKFPVPTNRLKCIEPESQSCSIHFLAQILVPLFLYLHVGIV